VAEPKGASIAYTLKVGLSLVYIDR
jgi:hypothetical protein